MSKNTRIKAKIPEPPDNGSDRLQADVINFNAEGSCPRLPDC